MDTQRPCLDVPALQQALNAERIARGSTWAALAREVHVSVPTMQHMHRRGTIEADAVVLLLQWLRRPCEDFVIRPAGSIAPRPAPAVPPLYGRFDTIALHKALDLERIARQLSWAEVGAELGVSAAVISRLTKGGRTHANLMIIAADWAGEPVEALLQPSSPVLQAARMDARARTRPGSDQ